MVLLAKYIWAISSKQDILWVKWIDAIYLKGQNIWDCKVHSDVSWYWRKLVNLKSVVNAEMLEKAAKNNKINISKLYQESHDHLFFQCQFSQQVRSRVAEWLGIDIWPVQFKDWIAWMVGKSKGLQQKLLAAVLAASVYMIW
ncbi:uncharacterized protein LOC133824096 [Humulus lupulus]|uniref:uncharacterized protein LOC133824096 n=1 Tax=Humulus lupulus TaxID=3486 RepID=UPI002B40D1BB|nr:uncharacterized protein LOC133824096 [Humulus lupulus]